MPGLMNFLEPFATGYLETKIAGQEKRAEYIQKQNELSDEKLAAIAKARSIKLNDLEIENDNLEAIRAKEETNLLKQHSDMNPTVLKYLKDQNYFYDKAAWTAFSAEFKKQGGGSDKWYQQLVIGGGNRSWEDMVAERIDNTFNKEDAKNTSDLADNTKDLLLDFSVEDQPFSLWNAKSINPIAIQEWKKSTQELKTGKLDFDIKQLEYDITEETKEDTIELLSANLSAKELSNEHQTIINSIAEKTKSSEISIRNTLAKIQDQKLKMVTWDADNKDTIGNLDIDIRNQNKELNKLAIEAAIYDAETQPAKDLIDNNLKQVDILAKQQNVDLLKEKNPLILDQLKINIANIEQGMSIAEASKDLNLTKLKLNVKNLEIENEMKTLMLENQPQETVLRLQGLQLNNIAQQYENLTATEIDRATLENIKNRNTQLEQNIGSFNEDQKTDLREQNLRIEKLQKEIDEAESIESYQQFDPNIPAQYEILKEAGIAESTLDSYKASNKIIQYELKSVNDQFEISGEPKVIDIAVANQQFDTSKQVIEKGITNETAKYFPTENIIFDKDNTVMGFKFQQGTLLAGKNDFFNKKTEQLLNDAIKNRIAPSAKTIALKTNQLYENIGKIIERTPFSDDVNKDAAIFHGLAGNSMMSMELLQSYLAHYGQSAELTKRRGFWLDKEDTRNDSTLASHIAKVSVELYKMIQEEKIAK